MQDGEVKRRKHEEVKSEAKTASVKFHQWLNVEEGAILARVKDASDANNDGGFDIIVSSP